MKKTPNGPRPLSMLSMAVMIITTIVSLRGLAAQAMYGYTSIFWYSLAAVLFLIPFALVCAELASTYTKRGGIFRWCGEAFGPRWGWAAIYLEWIMVVIWFPSVLMFCAVTLSYVFGFSGDDGNQLLTLGIVLAVYWLCMLNTFRGLGNNSRTGTIGGLSGTIIPGACLIILGGVYWLTGGENLIPQKPFLPDFSQYDTLVLAASIFLFYGGMEMQAVHVNRMRNPQREYPRAVLISVVVILAVFILGTLSIAMVTPQGNYNLLATLLEVYNTLWAYVGLPWLGRVMAVLIAFGILAQVSIIIAGPSTGLLEVGRAGYLPRYLQHVNRNGVQTHILIVQGIVVSIMSCVLIVLPSVQSAYQIMSQMATIIYLVLCGVIYAAFFRLRKTDPDTPRGFRVPGGEAGRWIVTVVGIVGLVLSGILSFLPPSQISVGSPVIYIGILAVGTLVLVIAPFIIFERRRSHWRDPQSDFEEFEQRQR